LRAVAYGAVLAFGAAVGVLRIAAGAHFFSDVVFAGVLMYLIVWVGHGLIYRWRATRVDEDRINDFLARAGMAVRNAFAALSRRLVDRSRKGS
jgi:membrane-associated phospholipid phosphatase